MAAKRKAQPAQPAQVKDVDLVAFRPNQSDNEVLARLREKLGLRNSDVMRLALRRLDEQEFPPKGSAAAD